MTTSTKKTDRQDMADYARSAFGMRSWIADVYADIATAPTPSGRSSVSTVRACAKLIQDDTGKVDPLVSLLATEVLRLNQAKIALDHNHETAMHLVLDLLGFEHASPDEQERLLTSLRSYIDRHECVDDRNFQQYAQALSRVENTSSDYAAAMAPGLVAEKFRCRYTGENALLRKLPDHGSCFFTYSRQVPSALSFGTPGSLLVRLVCYLVRDWDYSRNVVGSTGDGFREHFSGLGNLIAASYRSNVRRRSVLHFGVVGGLAPRYAASVLTVPHQVNSACLKRGSVVE